MVNKGGVPQTFQNVAPVTKTMTFASDFAHCNIEQVLQLKPWSEIWGGVILPNTKLGKITPPQIPDHYSAAIWYDKKGFKKYVHGA